MIPASRWNARNARRPAARLQSAYAASDAKLPRLACGSRGRAINHDRVEIHLHAGRYDRLFRQVVRGLVPRPLFHHALLERLRQQPSDFLAFEGDELAVSVGPVELGTEIKGMNSRVVFFKDEIVPLAQENIVFPDDSFLHCGFGNPQLLGRRSDDGPRFQENNPIFLGYIVRMDRDVVTWNFPSKDTHVVRCSLMVVGLQSGMGVKYQLKCFPASQARAQWNLARRR